MNQNLLRLGNLLAAYDQLPYGTKLHLNYHLRHQTPASTNVFAAHAGELELAGFLARLCELSSELHIENV